MGEGEIRVSVSVRFEEKRSGIARSRSHSRSFFMLPRLDFRLHRHWRLQADKLLVQFFINEKSLTYHQGPVSLRSPGWTRTSDPLINSQML
jgi:hypothetical protein